MGLRSVKRDRFYRVGMVAGYMGCVDFDFGHYTVCPVLLGQMGIWAVLAVLLGKMMEHPNQSQPNPGN